MDNLIDKTLSDVPNLQKLLIEKPEEYWTERGEKMALKLFHEMAERVPAYKDFLKKKSVNPDEIVTIEDFKKVPLIDKDNYLRSYPREMLCWDGKFASEQWVVSTTSGSTGEPFYFPRGDMQDEYYAISAELYLRENFNIQAKKTLYIDAFAMGAWIGGLFTYEAINRVAKKGYALTIITPGINKAEVISAVKNLGDSFDQVIIGCYPPVMRDIIDLGIESGLDWGKYNLGIVFSAEGFSEDFRDYVTKYGKLDNVYSSSLNHYGTVDLGTMSHETPFSIFVRRQAISDKTLFKTLFGNETKLPTFTQYIPEMFYFESVDNNVVCSSYSGLPLVRYDLNDRGGVMSLKQIQSSFSKVGKDIVKEMNLINIKPNWNLPIVYLYERSDFSVTYYGAQIYAEEIRKALMKSTLHKYVTGKFTMISDYDKDANSFLEINVELRSGISENREIENEVSKSVLELLIKENSEYKSNYSEYGEKINPIIKLWSNGHELHFSGKGKQKWVKK
jgi:phenylacetate-CoA ligase